MFENNKRLSFKFSFFIIEFPFVSNSISKVLKLPVYSIDRFFFEALISNTTEAAQQINNTINEKFTNIASECDLLSASDEDAMDYLERKISLILSGKEKKPPPKEKSTSARSNVSKKSIASKKTSEKSSSKSSKKGKKEKVKREPDVLMDLPVDLITEVLVEKLKEFRVGVIFESLNSIILRKPAIALNVLLNSLGNARYIHFVLFSYTYNDYCEYQAYVKEMEEQRKAEEIKRMLDSINEMGADEFSNVPEGYREIYRQNVLKARKMHSEMKKAALR